MDTITIKMRDIFNRIDPMGVYSNEDNNIDEYDSEIKDIRGNILNCKSERETKKLVLSVFEKWFGKNNTLTDWNKEKYNELSREVWNLRDTMIQR